MSGRARVEGEEEDVAAGPVVGGDAGTGPDQVPELLRRVRLEALRLLQREPGVLPLEDHLDDAAEDVVEVPQVVEGDLAPLPGERRALLLGLVEEGPCRGDVPLADLADGREALLDVGGNVPEEVGPRLPGEDPRPVPLGLEEAAVDAGRHLGGGVAAGGGGDLLLGPVPVAGEGEKLEEEGPFLRVGGRFADLLGQGLDRGLQVSRVQELLGRRHFGPPHSRHPGGAGATAGGGSVRDDRGC